jgi:WD40 repeat protein
MMEKEVNIQKLNYLTCSAHSKRVQFFCTAEDCKKTMICGECMVADKAHVAAHLDGFSSTEDYKNKVINSMLQKFEESLLKVTNQIDIITNNVEDVRSTFTKEINDLQAKTVLVVNDYFTTLKTKMQGLVGMKFENYLLSLKDLENELKDSKSNSETFLQNLKSFLDNDFQSSQVEEQIRFFNRKKFYDRSLIGRVDNMLNFIAENSKLTDNKQITKHTFKIDDAKMGKISENILEILKNTFEKHFEQNEMVRDLMSKPAFAINRLSQTYFTVSDSKKFADLDNFDKLNSFDLTSHPSTKISCMTVMDNKYVVTGLNDRCYKIWYILPSRMNMNMKTLIKGDLPFQPIHESSHTFHQAFISCLEYVKLNANTYRIFSGDFNGVLSVVDYEIREHKVSLASLVKTFPANEYKIINISYMPASESLAIGDCKSTIGFWNFEALSLIDVVRTKDPYEMVSFVFVNNYNYLCLMTESGELFSWKPRFASSGRVSKSKLHALYDAQSLELKGFDNHLKIAFENEAFHKKAFNIFSTNYRGDYMVFVSDGFCLKVISIFNGDTITQVEGAHYKGISSLYFIVNNSTESQIYRTLNIIESDHLQKAEVTSGPMDRTIKKFYSDLLNCFKIITISNKEYIRIWMFKDLEARLLDQEAHAGGSYGKCVFHVQNNRNENYLITCGKNSNKVVVYSLN